MAVVLLGHHVSERFATEHLVEVIKREFPHLKVMASEKDVDPLRIYI